MQPSLSKVQPFLSEIQPFLSNLLEHKCVEECAWTLGPLNRDGPYVHFEARWLRSCKQAFFSPVKMSVCDWLRQTLSPKRGRATRKAVDLTHTSFWSESSDISLVSLDKDPQCWEEGKYASRSAAAPGVAQKVNACTFATIHWRTTPSHDTSQMSGCTFLQLQKGRARTQAPLSKIVLSSYLRLR